MKINRINITRSNIISFFLISLIFLVNLILLTINFINLEEFGILGLTLFGIFPLLKAFFNEKIDLLAPSVLIPFIFLYYAIGPLKFSEMYPKEVVIKFIFLQLNGIVFLTLGLSGGKSIIKPKEFKIDYSNRELKVYEYSFYIFMSLSLISTLTELYTFGGLTNMIKVGYGTDRYTLLGSGVIIGGGIQWILISGIILISLGLFQNNKIKQISGNFIVVVCGLLFVLIGGRSTLVYSLIFFAVIYYYQNYKLNNKVILVIILLGISLAQLYSNARFYLPLGLTETVKNTYQILQKNPENFLPIPTNINEFVIPGRGLLNILNSEFNDFFLGRTYIGAIGSPIPVVSRVLNSFSINPSTWYLNEYHPNLYGSGAGLGFSPITEGYLNFGFIGVSLHMFVYGFIIKRVYFKLMTKKSLGLLLLYAGLLPMFLLDGLRIHSASMIYKLFRIYLMPYILYYIVYFIYFRKTKR